MSEREPLLRPSSPEEQPHLSIPQLARSLAAVRAGKLPSTSQLSTLLRTFLRSPLLQIEGTIFSTTYGSGRIGTGALTKEGESVRAALRELVEALLRVAMERNAEDQLQEFIFACRKAELELALPSTSKLPDDAGQRAQASLQNIVVLFATSPELRSLFVDSVLLLRDVFAAAVEGTGEVGDLAKVVADYVVESVAGDTVEEGRKGGPEEKPASLPPLAAAKSTDELRDEFVDRFKSILFKLQASPSYQSSILSLLSLLHLGFSSLLPSLSLNSPTTSPLSLLIPLIEPYTGGPHSLSPLRSLSSTLVAHLHSEDRLSPLIAQLDTLLETALLQPAFLTSSKAHRQLGEVYLAAEEIARTNPSFRDDLLVTLGELQRLFGVVKEDWVLGAVLSSLAKVGGAVEGWVAQAGKELSGVDGKGVVGDLVEWVLPRLGNMLRQVPLPRIEFASDDLDLAIDAPPFLSTSFIPDSLLFSTRSSYLISPSSPTPNQFESTSSILIQGLRMSTLDIGYWIHYKGACIGLMEAGLLDLHFGGAEEGGIELELDFETTEERSLFNLTASDVSITSFDLRPHASSHPILMWMIKPLLRRVMRTQVEKALREQVESLLRKVGRTGWEIRERARGGTGWMSWIGAAWEVLLEENEEEEGEGEQESEDEDAGLEFRISGKGVALDLEASVVGLGAEGVVLPEGEAETPVPRPTVVEIVRGEAGDAVREGKEAAAKVVGGMEQIGEAVEEFGEVVEEEEKEVGWRSEAFDWEE